MEKLSLYEIVNFNELEIKSNLKIKNIFFDKDRLYIYTKNNKFLMIQFIKKNINFISINDFIYEYVKFNNLNMDMILSRSRNKMITFYKGLLVYFLRQIYNVSYIMIAEIFHITQEGVLYYQRKMKEYIKKNKNPYITIYNNNIERFKLYV